MQMTGKKTSNIADIKEHTFDVVLNKPGGGPIGLTVEVRSDLSLPVQNVQKRITDKAVAKAKRNKTFTAEEREQNRYDMITAAIVSFKWGKNADGEEASFNGEQLPFTPENALKIYKALPFAVKQLDDAIGDETNFF